MPFIVNAGQRQLARQYIDCQPTGYSTATGGNGHVWRLWNASASITATASTTAAATDVWAAWNDGFANTSVASNSATTWGAWSREYHIVAESKAQRAARLEAERVEREERARIDRARATERAEVRRVAILKADKLLESVLNSAQRDQLKKLGGFVLRGQSGQLYRIRYGRSANVDVLDKDGNVIDRLCAHPIMDVPDQDTMVAQKVMLECDEQAFLRMANRHGPLPGQRVPREVLA